MDAPEVVVVNKTEVSCDGGNGPLGHPLVYLNLSTKGEVDCPYCDKKFIYKKDVA